MRRESESKQIQRIQKFCNLVVLTVLEEMDPEALVQTSLSTNSIIKISWTTVREWGSYEDEPKAQLSQKKNKQWRIRAAGILS